MKNNSEVFEKFMELRKTLSGKEGVPLELHLYADDSGHVSNGDSGEEYASWTTFEEAVKKLTEAIQHVVPQWRYHTCENGCCYFLANDRWGIRYGCAVNVFRSDRSMHELYFTKVVELLNDKLPLLSEVPMGTLVKAQDSEMVIVKGVFLTNDGDEVAPFAVAGFDEAGDAFNTFFERDQVKVHPDDMTIRGNIFRLVGSRAWSMVLLNELR